MTIRAGSGASVRNSPIGDIKQDDAAAGGSQLLGWETVRSERKRDRPAEELHSGRIFRRRILDLVRTRRPHDNAAA